MAGTITTIVHRIGPLQISDIAVLIAVSSPHRKDAYRANEYAIERIKEVVPIWKRKFGKTVQSGKDIKEVATIQLLKERTNVKVLYFAEIKEILQTDSETIDINESINVDAFKQNLFERHPSIKSKKFQVAVNEEFVQDEDIIQPTDTVALIPPVSGG